MDAMPTLPLEIEIFANSGHHYYFAPLPPRILKGVQELCKAQTDWEVWPGKKWIRYRYGTKDDNCGVWLAVESNLGAVSYTHLTLPTKRIV